MKPVRFDGVALKRFREERGMTLRELGDAAGMNAATIWRLEDGNRDPKVGTVVRLVQALNIDLEELIHE